MNHMSRCAMAAGILAPISVLISVFLIMDIRPGSHAGGSVLVWKLSFLTSPGSLRLIVLPQLVFYFLLSFISCIVGSRLRK